MHRSGLCLRFALAGAALAGLGACATNHPAEASRPVVQQVEDAKAGAAPVTPPPAAAGGEPAAAGTVAELQDLIKNHRVNELRTTYNASYGASLLFKPDDLTYYVALFQQRDFWSVVKTTSASQAEATYRAFIARTAALAAVDVDRIRLQAENTKAEERVNASMARLNALQADQALRVQQDQVVAARQSQLQAEASRLSQQQQDVRAQLRALQRQIDALQAEQARLSGHPSRKARAVAKKKPVQTK
jgi:hypothetical protein